jgi:tetratricopeptide (TPR) repeat protein
VTDVQSPTSERTSDDRFLDHLSSAADMVGARRFREAEVEVLRALSITPSDLRGLKLLALVRFKLGHLDQARALCREIAAAAPRDAGVRLKLGLIALKLDRLDESVQELELAARLAPDDVRPWNYLGFAYARCGDRARAAEAFRRAGSEAMAVEMESDAVEQRPERAPAAPTRVEVDGASARSTYGSGRAVISPGALPSTAFEPAFDLSLPMPLEPRATPAAEDGEARQEPEAIADERPTTAEIRSLRAGAAETPAEPLVGFAVAQLASPLHRGAWVGAAARLPVEDGAFVRADAALACAGRVRWEPAQRRVQGRPTSDPLGADKPFYRVQGRGELFVAAPVGRLIPLRLEDDILYVREDAVVAFEGTVSWEYGHIPRATLRMLQFRGRGLVALCVRGETGAIKVSPDRPVQVAARNLLGWVGRVVARGGSLGTEGSSGPEDAGALPLSPIFSPILPITCEGEGVVLFQVEREREEGGRSV